MARAMHDTLQLVMTLLVRDEQDILADNIEFHRARGVDHFIITDNKSVDETPAIIKDYVKRGWATAIHEPADDYDQSAWVTRMARLAACELGADWIINSDADEFWMPWSGSLKDCYAAIPGDVGVVLSARHDFVIATDLDGAWHHRMIYRKAVSLNHIGRPLPPKVAHRAGADVVVLQGNHSVTGLEGREVGSDNPQILHFPIRSKAQFENKIINGGAAYQRNTKLPKTVARGWRRLYDELRRDGSLQPHIDSVSLTSDQIATGLNDEVLIEDRRLAEFFDRQC